MRICLFILTVSLFLFQIGAQTNKKIKSLQAQKIEIKKGLVRSEKELNVTKKDVSYKMKNIDLLGNQVENRSRYITEVAQEMSNLDQKILHLQTEVETVEKELKTNKKHYIVGLRYGRANRNVMRSLLYILSAQSASQIFRRAQYAKEYVKYQERMGERIMNKQNELLKKQNELLSAKSQLNQLIRESMSQRVQLYVQQERQKGMVQSLQKKQKDLMRQMAEQRQKISELDKKIDQMIAWEVEQARKRAAAAAAKKREAARKAEAKRRADAEARRKAAAAAAAENRRRVEAEKEKERKALAAANAATTDADTQKAKKEVSDARARLQEAQRKQTSDARIASTPVEVTPLREWKDPEEYKLNGSFEKNKGRLPVPITGSYQIGGRFGTYNVPGLKNVQLDNKGTYYIGRSGARARAVFDGEVTAIFQFGPTKNILIRHGSYISVYCNLSSVIVARGQKVSVRDLLGAVADDGSGNCVLQFQLRKEKAKLNPESWIGR